ncbi:MAG: DUF2878 domain-containing protein [Gammaproteobacteria bacterium]|nr:DUF2878 domain-containing protein [Pseudomonadales bacterium]MCP5346156.1 DUF2878 domain-containing protein [Pseudomonadales bacterium]
MSVLKLLTSSPVNMAVNNLFWAGCVIGRYDLLWLVAPAILGYLALLLAAGTLHWQQLWPTIVLGVVVDSLYTATGIFQFPDHSLLLPLWMWALWIAFATTLPMSLRWLGKHPLVAALTGALGFPFSYLLGFELGAIAYPHSLYPTLLLIGITWALLLPLLYRWTQSAPVSVHAPA